MMHHKPPQDFFRRGLPLLAAAFMQASLLNAATGGKIAGRILQASDKAPLLGANIVVEGTFLGAMSDAEGDYFILNVPPGVVSVKTTMMGYKTLIKTRVNVNTSHTTTVDFLMEETVIEAGEVVTVTAERPLVEKDKTATRHFVEAEEIAARPTSQLTDILATLPGITRDPGGELEVRRGSLDQISFLIDGIRARNPLDFEPYTNINLSSIQELEIITGGFNAEYGEAQSGVFNIVTKEGSGRLSGSSEFRWTPPGKYHWGTALYDYSTTRYWENTHARHLEWWIDNPDQWIDSNGMYGNDARCIWTPEQAYQDYMNTHQPLTDYTNRSGYQGEIALGGPAILKGLYFFTSMRYRTAPPITGNSYRKMGTWLDGTAKLTYRLNERIRLMASGFYGRENTNTGMEWMELTTGLAGKYTYWDYAGYPENRIDGQTLKMTHVLSKSTYYEIYADRIFRYRSQSTFPGDEGGWETGTVTEDRLRAVDESGTPVPGAYGNRIGLHNTGYFYRGKDRITDWTLSGDLISQINKKWQFKGGFDFTYYVIDRFQEAKAWAIVEKDVYYPWEGDIYFQNKLEFEGLIMNLGLRYDFYNPNDRVYLNLFDPFDLISAARENRTPSAQTRETSTFGQLSPRIGISHPISDKTVLHFAYGHFFQRANFGNYGEGTGTYSDPVNGILNTYVSNPLLGDPAPTNLGNRELRPRKTVAFEVGIERNFGGLIADVTAFYQDITKTVRTVKVLMLNNTKYLTTGNSDYSDSKGIEIEIRRPLSGFWGGYLNYSWTTGIYG
ncbi:TonB-dependent receptor, partial [bacterium]|nr:TonB-dependent receptor [bacterium]